MKSRIKILNKKPVISDAEITSMMDFDHLVSQSMAGAGVGAHEALSTGIKTGVSAVVKTAITSVIIVSAGTYMWWSSSNESIEKPLVESVEQQSIVEVIEEEQVGLSSSDLPVVEKVADLEPENNNAIIAKSKKDESKFEKADPKEEEEDVPIAVNSRNREGYRPAKPAAGYDQLYEYFSKELVLPQTVAERQTEVTVEVQFEVDAEGKIGTIQIKNAQDSALENSIRTLIQKMPEWKPATLNGKPMKSSLSLPLNFNSTPNE